MKARARTPSHFTSNMWEGESKGCPPRAASIGSMLRGSAPRRLDGCAPGCAEGAAYEGSGVISRPQSCSRQPPVTGSLTAHMIAQRQGRWNAPSAEVVRLHAGDKHGAASHIPIVERIFCLSSG